MPGWNEMDHSYYSGMTVQDLILPPGIVVVRQHRKASSKQFGFSFTNEATDFLRFFANS